MTILNWTTDDALSRMRARGWIERNREPEPHEGRVVVTLFHPCKAAGGPGDRTIGPVVTFRSLSLDNATPSQLNLFD
jgi:hypothetical protein